ncbi:MAG: hypothetical protein ACQ9MH_01270 [Nitrospinales bacterium]
MSEQKVTVEQVRVAQEKFISGSSLHDNKNYKDAIEAFKESSSQKPDLGNQLEILEQNLVKGSYKLLQKSIAYMGCAAKNLYDSINQLSEEERDQVPIDKSLDKVFHSWE